MVNVRVLADRRVSSRWWNRWQGITPSTSSNFFSNINSFQSLSTVPSSPMRTCEQPCCCSRLSGFWPFHLQLSLANSVTPDLEFSQWLILAKTQMVGSFLLIPKFYSWTRVSRFSIRWYCFIQLNNCSNFSFFFQFICTVVTSWLDNRHASFSPFITIFL
jgi:hypothetical protein